MKQSTSQRAWLNRNIIGFGLGSFLSDLSHEMTTLVLPLLIAGLVGKMDAPFYVGLIAGVADAGASFARIYFGYLTDKLAHRKPFIMAGYTMSCIFISLTGFAQHIWVVLLSRLLAWLGKGMREPARDALIAESVDQKYYGRAFGFHRAMDTLGALIGPLITFTLFPFVSIRSIFFISFIPSFFSVVAIWALTQDKPHEVDRWTMNIRRYLTLLPLRFWYFAAILFLFSIGNYHQMLIVLRAQELFGIENTFLASGMVVLLYGFFNVARAVGEYLIGSLSDYFNRKKLLALCGFGLFGCVSLLLSVTDSSFIMGFIFFLGGISIGSYSALEKAYAADLLPPEVRGSGYGVLQALRGIGAFVSSFAVGFLWTTFSPAVGFFYAAITSFVAALLLLTY